MDVQPEVSRVMMRAYSQNTRMTSDSGSHSSTIRVVLDSTQTNTLDEDGQRVEQDRLTGN